MLPADEGFDLADPTRSQIHHRLVLEPQLVRRDRPPQLRLRLQSSTPPSVHRRVVDGKRAAAMLGVVHRQVGLPQHVVRAVPPGHPERDADARRCAHFLTVDRHRLPQTRNQALGHGHRLGLANSLQQHRELVPTQPGYRVVWPGLRRQSLTDGQQYGVAAAMPKAVVDHLEVVQIHEEDGDGRGAIQRPGQPIQKERPVRQTGQRVVERLVGQLGLQGQPRRHVLGDDEHRRSRLEDQGM